MEFDLIRKLSKHLDRKQTFDLVSCKKIFYRTSEVDKKETSDLVS